MQVKAQRPNKFSLKPCLGITASQLHGDAYDGYHKLGLVAGLYVNAALKERSSLEFGLIFDQKGARKNQNPAKFDYRYYYLNLNYLEVPLIYRWQPNRFFFTLGASFAYLISYYEASEAGNLTGKIPFNSTEYSVNTGIGRMISQKMAIEIRFNNSFLPVKPLPPGYTKPYYNNIIARTFSNGCYNNIVQIAFTYKLTPGKKRESKEED
jgi:hypothetical protein